MQTTKTFSGERLRRIRHAKGWTQAELARRAGVRERQIIRWENEQNVPRLEAVGQLAAATAEPFDAFFAESDVQEEAQQGDPFRAGAGSSEPRGQADGAGAGRRRARRPDVTKDAA